MNPNKRFLIIAITVVFISFVIFFIPGFTQKEKIISKNTDTIIPGKSPKQDTILEINNHKVFIKICNGKKKGTFLLLHGWNLPAEDWCSKTSLCNEAVKLGYCVVLPDMGKSIYQENNFPETRNEWRIFPTRKWLSDTLILLLQNKYSLLLKNEDNYIVGLSTGARGVALLLLDLPELFKCAAALSGDYNQMKMPADKLMTGFYGPIDKFKDRWENTDNPASRIKEYKTPIYLGHGKLDKVVPPEQTQLFYDSLKKYHPDLKIKLNMPDAQHDYDYWGSEVENVLKFFELK
jgi:dienelactone hydrolase